MQTRCPQCHQTIEVLSESTFRDIPCPACGSSFSLISDDCSATISISQERTIGHFSIVSRLGMGSFGSVWKARDQELARFVALKIPRREIMGSGEIDLFLREARAAAQLQHPNIVSVYEVGRDGDTVYIVSDLVDGVTLGDWLTVNRMSPREAATLCRKIALALDHAHQRGVIHRDLKPSNIMLDAETEPHIMDFGLAKREAGEVTMTFEGKLVGTPAYMSPEQASGNAHQADRRSDIYSLGVVLFELLTSERPFRGNARMLLHQVIHDDPPSPRRLNHSIPRDLETICLKCLRKEPRARYETAAELADDLTRFLEGREIGARPSGTVERLWRIARRNPIVTSLATAVTVLLITALGFLFWFLEERAVRAERDAVALQQRLKRREESSRKVLEALDEAAQLRGQAEAQPLDGTRWHLAIGAARRAQQLLDLEPATPDLTRRVSDLLTALERDSAAARLESEKQKRLQRLLNELENARMAMTAPNEQGLFDRRTATDVYAQAFREYGLDFEQLSSAEIVQHIEALPLEIRHSIAGAFDQWLYAGWAGVWEEAARRWHQPGSNIWEKVGLSATLIQELTSNVPEWNKLLLVANQIDPDPLRVRLREAASRFELSRFQELTALPEIDSLPAESLMLAAGILKHTGDLTKSAELLQRGLIQQPDDFWLHHNLGDVYNDAGQFEDAARHYAAAVSIRPDTTLLLCKYGLALSNRKKHFEAIAVLRRALEVTPSSAHAYHNLGIVLARNQETDAAIEAYRNATEIAPGFLNAYRNLGKLLVSKSDWQGAAAAFERVVAVEPADANSCQQLGIALAHLGQAPKGLEHCLQAVRLRDSGDVAHVLAKEMSSAAAPVEAWSLVQEAIRRDCKNAALVETCLNVARQLRNAGQDQLAYQAYLVGLGRSGWNNNACRELAELVVRRTPLPAGLRELHDLNLANRMMSLLFVAELLCLEERKDEYRAFCREVWEKYATSTDHFEQYSVARIVLMTPESGIEVDKVVQLAESATAMIRNAWYLNTLALAYFRAGRLDEARQMVELSLMAEPTWAPPLNWLLLGMIYQQEGKPEEARQWFERARAEPLKFPAQDILEIQLRRREVETN